MGTVRIKGGNVQPLWAGHPWVFAQAVQRVDGAPGLGDQVRVVDPEGRFLGSGFWSPKSAIPVRIMSRDPNERLDGAAIGRRLQRAASFRRDTLKLPSGETTGFRLVHAEGDSLPGLIVDVYGKVAVAQILTAGMEARAEEIFAQIARVASVETVIRAATDQRRGEGFAAEWAVVRGPEPSDLEFQERGFEMRIPTALTQKTGFYFDQREVRARLESLSRGRRVLDAYAYVGAMSLSAARGGASEVVAMERSAPVVAAGATLARHHGHGETIRFLREDVKKGLPRLVQDSERFDVVVIDPPKLAPTKRHRQQAERAYHRLNVLAMKLAQDGAVLLSCSCSGAIRPDEFLRILTRAAKEARVGLTLLELASQGPDHAVPAAFPEGRYLKSAFLRVER